MKELRAHLSPHTNYSSVKNIIVERSFFLPLMTCNGWKNKKCERMQPISGIEVKKLRFPTFVKLHYLYGFLLRFERMRKVDGDKKMNNGIIKTTITARIA